VVHRNGAGHRILHGLNCQYIAVIYIVVIRQQFCRRDCQSGIFGSVITVGIGRGVVITAGYGNRNFFGISCALVIGDNHGEFFIVAFISTQGLNIGGRVIEIVGPFTQAVDSEAAIGAYWILN